MRVRRPTLLPGMRPARNHVAMVRLLTRQMAAASAVVTKGPLVLGMIVPSRAGQVLGAWHCSSRPGEGAHAARSNPDSLGANPRALAE